MMSKKGIYATVSLLSLLALTACGNKSSDTSSKKESTSITKPAKSSEKISSSDSSGKKSQTSSQVKEGMDLEQIKAGNYAGLQGEWYELGHGRNYIPGKSGTNYQPGGNDVLTITNDTISASGMSISGQTLTDDNGEHSLKFSESDGILKATLQDASKVAVNWSVTFYPKGSTTAFSNDGSTNDQNVIVVWTSNNQYTQIFAQAGTKTATDKPEADTKTATSGVDLNQIMNNNFVSLVGTWKNPNTGETIVVTDKVEHRPADVPDHLGPVGAVLDTPVREGHQDVFIPIRIENGHLLLTKSNYGVVLGGHPFILVPAGVKLSDADDSDENKDRLISGGGQAGYKESAYYKVN